MMLGMNLSMAGNPSQITVIQQAIAVLRKFGLNAHIYLPGVGMLNGLTAANYLDSAGTTAGTVDQPVGLVLDAAGSLGVELVTNGDFSSGVSSWAQSTANYWVASGGRAYHALSTGYNEMTQVVPTKTGGVWIEFDYQCLTASNTAQWFYTNGAGVVRTADTVGLEKLSAGVGKIRYFSADGIQKIGFARYTTAEFYIDNISVREVTGIHASQPTTASKPVLRRGAVNLLTYSGDMTLAPWGDVRANRGVDTVTATATSVNGFAIASALVSSQTTATAQVELKKGASDWASVLFWDGSASGVRQWINLSTGVLASTATLGTGWSISQAEITSGITGYYILTLRVSKPTGLGGINIYPSTQTDGAYGCNINDTGYIRRVAIFAGTYTAAQIQALGGIPLTTTAPASTALGPYWWDTTGSKTLNATFPTGNESVTVIDAKSTGQVTLTGQSVVGAYSISTPTNGRIIVNGALTAPELALLQSLANKMAGL